MSLPTWPLELRPELQEFAQQMGTDIDTAGRLLAGLAARRLRQLPRPPRALCWCSCHRSPRPLELIDE